MRSAWWVDRRMGWVGERMGGRLGVCLAGVEAYEVGAWCGGSEVMCVRSEVEVGLGVDRRWFREWWDGVERGSELGWDCGIVFLVPAARVGLPCREAKEHISQQVRQPLIFLEGNDKRRRV